ncbi:MAG: LysR family transcriptional regulator [Lachnospiraceae bacterium]|nr:LysR family transcriptional regulator [Lachnospiraceae bacterium]
MTFKQIEYALELAGTLSFRAAAERCYISQPAFSRQIQTLEEEIGVSLFERTGKGVRLTAAGELFCQEMRQISRQANTVITRVKNYGGKHQGILRIGPPDYFTKDLLRKIVEPLLEQYPNLLVEFPPFHGHDRVDRFLKNQLDVIFFPARAFEGIPGICYKIYKKSCIYCVVNKDDELAEKKQICAMDLSGKQVYINSGKVLEELAQEQDRLLATIPIQSVLCETYPEAELWISMKKGVALVPGFCHNDDDSLVWIPYEGAPTIDYAIAWHEEDHREELEALVRQVCSVYEMLAEEPGRII